MRAIEAGHVYEVQARGFDADYWGVPPYARLR